jgi:hypothetical protein
MSEIIVAYDQSVYATVDTDTRKVVREETGAAPSDGRLVELIAVDRAARRFMAAMLARETRRTTA